MRVIIAKDYDEMSKFAAEELITDINKNPNIVLGLATGGTPIGMYKELIKMNKEEKVNFSNVKTINLDEYVGLSGEHKQSYRYFMNENLFNHININKENTFVPNGLAIDIENECKDYDKRISELGGIDVQLLGIGNNGHIGFNEPNDFLNLTTHLTELKNNTIEANARFFDSIDEVPRKAITMGLGGIMKARKIILIASGENKTDIIEKLINGKITTQVPASMLQMHNNLVLIVDKEAAKNLKEI